MFYRPRRLSFSPPAYNYRDPFHVGNFDCMHNLNTVLDGTMQALLWPPINPSLERRANKVHSPLVSGKTQFAFYLSRQSDNLPSAYYLIIGGGAN